MDLELDTSGTTISESTSKGNGDLGVLDSVSESERVGVGSEQGMLDVFVTKCQVAYSDLEITAISVESILDSNDAEEAKAELADLERILDTFNVAHFAIMRLCQKGNRDGKVYEDRRMKFLLRYKDLRNKLNKVCKGAGTDGVGGSRSQGTRFKLPKMDIPVFSGVPDEWEAFKRLYVPLIHNSGDLTLFDKHQFLRSRLRGEPLTLIDGLPLEDSFYDTAWEIVNAHYDDPLKRIYRYMDAIQNFQSPSQGKRPVPLRNLITHFRANVKALQITLAENTAIDAVSQFCIYTFLNHSDKATRTDWEREMQRRQKFATFDEFLQYMEGRCNAFERAGISSARAPDGPIHQSKGKTLALNEKKGKRRCYYCKDEGHAMYQCDGFSQLSNEQRYTAVKKKRLCVRCLGARCSGRCTFSCKKYSGRHHTLLHRDTNKPSGELNNILVSNSDICALKTNVPNPKSNLLTGWIGSLVTDSVNALLATAMVKVSYKTRAKELPARALLDSGSQFNLITSRMVRMLGAEVVSDPHSVSGIGNSLTSVQKGVNVRISAHNSAFNCMLYCLVLEEIVDLVPSDGFSVTGWNIPEKLKLADPHFNVPGRVDLLLGIRVFWNILRPKSIKLRYNLPRLNETKLGWIVTDDRELEECDSASADYILFTGEINQNCLSSILERFWFLDEETKRDYSFEENECERKFMDSTIRLGSGRFMVRLPFKDSPQKLGHSRTQALKRFYYLEKRFAGNSKFASDYAACIGDYLSQGHMKEITETLDEKCYYLPHHAVIKESSTSTKLRVVFDASMKTTSGISLNQCLMVGPVVQADLISIMIRFRMHRFAFVADIVQMYRQIKVHHDDTPYQRIFWRKNANEPLGVYELTTVTFGMSSAPYLATRCLKKLAEDQENEYPRASKIVYHDMYVDDVLTGADSLELASESQGQLINLFEKAGFQLSKWCANETELLKRIPENRREINYSLNLGSEDVIKTLGLFWFPAEDNFRIAVRVREATVQCTKRQVLSVIASIFDPLGLIGPVTVVAKLFMQSLWLKSSSDSIKQKSLGWDDRLSEHLQKIWLEFSSQLPSLTKLAVPRHLLYTKGCKFVELHGFADASERAYGAVFYLRTAGIGNANANTRLMYSKSRVAPIKRQSLPRLELCAALLLAEMTEKVVDSLRNEFNIRITRLWSDSEIVLHWINSASNRWQTFVANRVQKIQNYTKGCYWDHVDSEMNPADLLSRGIKPQELQECDLWWHGPKWLSGNNEPASSEVKFKIRQSIQLELKHPRGALACTAISINSLFTRYSDYVKLVRQTAWIMRFIWNAHWYGPRLYDSLRKYEVESALMTLIKVSQREYFRDEFRALENNLNLKKDSPLQSLSPFLDAQGIIRVGGRLQNSNLSYEQRHQIVLSPKHTLTKLIVEYEHKRHLHAGPQLLKSVLRRKYWILRVSNVISHVIIHCHKCIRMKADTRNQIMAALPRSRVVPSRAFMVTGVDYAGPFQIIGKGGRHKVMVKAYVALFVCFTTKAIHLELVSDLTSETFLAALGRFMDVRGIPKEIHSDNGTTFVGAKSSLQQLRDLFKTHKDLILRYTVEKNCQWHFIPPRAPHFGGLWEAGVKSVKVHLNKVLRDASHVALNYEQFLTLLKRVEAILNSRPLFPESQDPNDLNALTPGHFLIGEPLTALPNPDLTSVTVNRLKHWEQVKQMQQRFWKRWSKEYLNTLQQRSKWRVRKNELTVGDLVIIMDDNASPMRWPLGRVTQLNLGADGLVRVVTLKTANGILKRPITRLVYLPCVGQGVNVER